MPSRADFSFYELVPDLGRLSLVDVGAAPTGQPPPYQPWIDRGQATIASFEPDPAAFAQLKANATAAERVFPYFIGDGGPATYYQTTSGPTGSIYPPNDALLARFSGLPELTKV